jgi:hypothetical protein
MNSSRYSILLIFVFLTGCVTSYTPGNIDNEQALVVEGLITDQPGPYTVNISLSAQRWSANTYIRMSEFKVWITDDLGAKYDLKEGNIVGSYLSDPATFRAEAGRTYTLHLITNQRLGSIGYESVPMKMVPVPPVDSVYYEKQDYFQPGLGSVEGCRIYLDAWDPEAACRFYRWEYAETWEFRLPDDYMIQNRTCWRTETSDALMIKNASTLENLKISRFQLLSIQNPVDRLCIKYSLLVSQFSLNEDEFYYWEKVKRMVESSGGLYDVVPASIPSNVYCPEDITRKVLGYFCVSAMTSKRIFIRDNFSGTNMLYYNCVADTIHKSGLAWVKYNYVTHRNDTVTGENISYWALYDYPSRVPPVKIITWDKGCADCTTRGIVNKPDFWDDDIK